MKVNLEQVEHTAKSLQIEESKVTEMVESLKRAIEEEKELKGKAEREKNIFVALINSSGLRQDEKELFESLPLYIFQIPEESDHNELPAKIEKACYEFNASKKGMKEPVLNIFDGTNVIQNKFFKDQKIKRVTKEPMIIILSDSDPFSNNV